MTPGLSNRRCGPCAQENKIDFNRLFKRKTTFAEYFFQIFICRILLQLFLGSLVLQDSHHFSSLWFAESFSTYFSPVFSGVSLWRQPSLRQSLIPAFFQQSSLLTWAVFDDSLSRQPLQTTTTSAVFDESLSRQPSLQQSLMIVLFLARTLRKEPDTCIQCTYIEIFILTNTRIFKNTFHICI